MIELFLNPDTKWYAEKTNALNAVTRDLKYGNPIKHKKQMDAIRRFNDVLRTIDELCNVFNRDTKGSVKNIQDLMLSYTNNVVNRHNKIYEQTEKRS